jgi:HEAT repeat protein
MLAIEFIEQERAPSCLSRILDLLQSEKDEIVIERAVNALCNLRNPDSIPHLLRMLVEKSGNIRTILLPTLEKDKEAMDSDTRRLFDLTKRIALGERTIGFRDSIFLRRFSKKHPEMKGLVKILRERQTRRQVMQNE